MNSSMYLVKFAYFGTLNHPQNDKSGFARKNLLWRMIILARMLLQCVSFVHHG